MSYTTDSSDLLKTIKLYYKDNFSLLELGAGDAELSEELNRLANGKFVTIDIQKKNAQKAISKNIKTVLTDVKQVSIKNESFDMVVFNPPFFKIGEGVLSKDSSKNIERHELMATLNDFLNCANGAVKKNGIIIFIIPYKRLIEIANEVKFVSIKGSNKLATARAIVVL